MKRWIALILILVLTIPSALAVTYRRGDESEDIRQVQLHLYGLGYLNDSPDGKFGPKTEQAVKSFQKAHSMSQTGEMDEFTISEIRRCFDGCTDPTWAIVQGFCEWKKYNSGNKLDFRTQVMGITPYDSYDGIEMAYYCEDEYGLQIYPDPGTYQWLRTRKTLKPRSRVFTDYIALENASEIASVYAAVRAVIIDGERYETKPEAMHYVEFRIK